MAVTVTGGRVTVSAPVPAPVVRALSGLRRAAARGRGGDGGGGLRVAAAPAVRPERRDLAEAAAFLEVGRGRDAAVPADEALPDGWGRAELAAAVDALWWYHTIDLPHGVTTPGTYDHRPLVAHYGLPASLAGERVLDVATFDGFWAFELERRGAEVVATDLAGVDDLDLPPAVRGALAGRGLDWRTGTGFRLAHRALGSQVERIERSVYDLDPADLGTFDLVHVSDLLLHLRDPVAALAAVARVTRGRAVVTDCYDPRVPAGLTRYAGGFRGATWWLPSLETLVQMTADAGFRDVRVQRTFNLAARGAPSGFWRATLLATA